MLPIKIKYDDTLVSRKWFPFVGSLGCIDCVVWGKRSHICENYNKKLCSKIKNHAALKYEILMSLDTEKCMSVVGPYKASVHDMNVFWKRTNVWMLRMHGKMLIVNSIYLPGHKREHQNENGMFAIPNSIDTDELKNLKGMHIAHTRHLMAA